MKTHSFSRLKKLVAGAMFALMLAAPVVQAQATAPDIYYSYASPTSFNPTNNETVDIFWYANTLEASVQIDIFDGLPGNGGQLVWTLVGETGIESAPNPAVWSGKIGGQPYPDGTYYYRVHVENELNQQDEWVGSFEIVGGSTNGGNDPQITNVSVSDDPFDPTNNETTTVSFDVDQCVFVTVEVEDNNNNTVATLANNQSQCLPAGNHDFTWDGEDQTNTVVNEGIYTFEITVTNNNGTDTAADTVEVEYDGGNNNGDAPEILELYADPDEFNPNDGEETDIFFRLDKDAEVTLQILDGNTVIRTLVNDGNADAGLSFVEWDGEDNSNDIVDDGTYAVRLVACDEVNTSACDTAFTTVEVTDDTGNNNGSMQITNDFASPNPFNPDEENTRIYYTINMDGDVTIEIFDEDDDLVRTLLDDVNRNSGANSTTWNGEDRFSNELPDGDYTYEITACDENDSSDCDTETGTIEIDHDLDGNNGGDLISNVHVNNPVFDPTENEESQLCFDIEQDNVEITIQVLDGNSVVRTLLDEVELDEQNNRCYDWDGEDDDNDLLDDDVYQYRIRAEKADDVEVAFAYTELDTDGIIIGFPDDDDFCGGFWDVPSDSPFCEAIRLMFFRGIFTGYPDGSFQPYAPINRAETVKVVLLALDYNILSDDGTNLGYWDVIPRSWYMPYLRTAQREGVATGYPDGAFRPGGHINRVELLRVFLEASDINVPHCNVQPYPDTPIQLDTRWYMDYVCFAKAYGLMGTDANGNFNPAQPMTRGDVAMLFYNFEIRGLFGGYNQTYYNNYWNNFVPGYYTTPGYGYGYNMYNGYGYSY